MGVVVLENGAPVYYGVKSLTKARLYRRKVRTAHDDGHLLLKRVAAPARLPLKQVHKIIQKLIDTFNPKCLVIEKPFDRWRKQSKLLNKLVKEITRTVRQNNVELIELSPEEVRLTITKNEHATKQDIVNALSSISDLSVLLEFDRINDRYWHHMFDALALAVAVEMKAQL